jgi:hypothetical protein
MGFIYTLNHPPPLKRPTNWAAMAKNLPAAGSYSNSIMIGNSISKSRWKREGKRAATRQHM